MPAELRSPVKIEVEKLEREERLEAVLRTRNDEDLDLEVVPIEGKGRGVLARKNFTKGEPVVEYKGQLITVKEGEKKMID